MGLISNCCCNEGSLIERLIDFLNANRNGQCKSSEETFKKLFCDISSMFPGLLLSAKTGAVGSIEPFF